MDYRNCEKYYEINNDILGKGTFGIVKQACNLSKNTLYAIKIIDKSKLRPSDAKRIKTEVDILNSVEHINIISLYEVFENDKYIHLVFELATGGDLFHNIIKKSKYKENEARHIVKQLLDCVNYLHSHNIVHRDIKAENILYLTKESNSLIKLADFGLSTYIKPNEKLFLVCGTPGYVAPEVITTPSIGYDQSIDLWSIGVIAYILLSGCPPFYNETIEKLFIQIKNIHYSFNHELFNNISFDAKDFIQRLLVYNNERISVNDALNHPWIINSNQFDSSIESSLSRSIDSNLSASTDSCIDSCIDSCLHSPVTSNVVSGLDSRVDSIKGTNSNRKRLKGIIRAIQAARLLYNEINLKNNLVN